MSKHEPVKMRVLKRSRAAPQRGDVFALSFVEGRYLFGRVISTEAKWTLAEGADPAILIYVFRDVSPSKDVPHRDGLQPSRLLVPPMMTNRLPWSRGYFETITNMEVLPGETLEKHCFLSGSRGRYFDDHGNEVAGPIEPVGDHGLHSFQTIDDEVRDALAHRE